MLIVSPAEPCCATVLGMVAAFERRAVAAASAIAAAYGIAPDEAVVIYSGSNVLVHFARRG